MARHRLNGRRTTLAVLLFACLLLLPSGAVALDHGRPVNIGALNVSWGPTPITVGLRDGLVALGYQEGEHFNIGVRFVSGNLAKLPGAAQDLAEAGADIILALGTASAKAAQRVIRRIPVVFVIEDDPVKAGLVSSFSRPGGNITGVTGDHTSLGPKRL